MRSVAETKSISANGKAPTVLDVTSITSGYGAANVLNEVSISVGAGEIVALLGPNGAGKTTLVITIAGQLPLRGGQISFLGDRLSGPVHRRAKQGVVYIPETRSVFRSLSVRKNLELGRGGIDDVLELFPELAALLNRQAGLLSGGEQQMVSLGRALVSKPRLLLLDELSLGLAPMIVDRLLERIRKAAESGTAVLLVEQHARKALAVADRGYVLQRGNVVLAGTGSDLLADIGAIETTYLAGRAEEE